MKSKVTSTELQKSPVRFLKWISLSLICLAAYTPAQAKVCNSLTNAQKKMVAQRYSHDPFHMIESLVKVATNKKATAEQKNKSLIYVYDLPMIYSQTYKHHKSKLFKDSYMTYIKSQLFGFYDKLYNDKTALFIKQKFDFLKPHEKENLKKGSVQFLSFQKKGCSYEEKKLLGCKEGYYKISTKASPELACNYPELMESFNVDYFLTYNRTYGFKITDVHVSGKSVTLDLFKYMNHLQKTGYNKTALLTQLKTLYSQEEPFSFPKRMTHSRNVIAIFKENPDRLPTSL